MKQFINYLIQYQGAIRKFFIALAAAIAQTIVVWTTDNVITGPEWLTVALAFLAAFGVYAVPNRDGV